MRKAETRKDKIAKMGCWLMFVPLFFGFFLAAFDVASRSIEIRRFRSERHIQTITNAYQFNLSQNETLRVSEYRRGAMQSPSQLRIVIEGLDSVDSFLSRFNSDIEETEPEIYQINIFHEPFRTMDSRAILTFFHNENELSAEICMVTFPHNFEELRRMLNTYHPIWLSPFFLIPAIIHIALIAYRVVRIIKRKNAG
jgi:hypothetical protein